MTLPESLDALIAEQERYARLAVGSFSAEPAVVIALARVAKAAAIPVNVMPPHGTVPMRDALRDLAAALGSEI